LNKSKSNPEAGVRLQVYLARCGLGSRRNCELLIQHGKVTINGAPVTRMGEKVLPNDIVTLDGRKVTPSANRIYVALHKPRGFICASSDPEGRPLASSLFASAFKERLFHVGRLDFLSTGLILYTNDGEFSRIVSHPASRVEKEYLVETGRAVEEAFLRQYSKGIRVGEVTYRCEGFTLRGPHSAHITLLEGKNRELRNVFASRNIRLKRVHRLRIGPVTLRGIPPGHFRRLTEREVRWFYDQADRPANPRSSPPVEKDTTQVAARPGAARPSGAKTGWAKPGVARPGAAKQRPGAARPGAARPGASRPGAPRPGAANHGAARPGGSKPGGFKASRPGPGGTRPRRSRPGDRPGPARRGR
jgi:23S rRNA pseudouridine2605 synthase